MDINVLGISGSPVKGGNCETFLDRMLATAGKKSGVITEAAHLSRLTVGDCVHCNFCLRKQTKDKYCALDDDAQPLFEKIEIADIIVLAAPVYFMRTSGRMASFLDRLRVFVFGNVASGKMKNKVGVSAAVAWARNGGFETTHLCHIEAFLTLEMIPASVHHCISPLGASGVSSPYGSGIFDKEIRLGVERDSPGIHSADAHINRAVELVKLIKK